MDNQEQNINPKVSVIVPVYNVEKYLERCLQSVIKQTLRDIEIICVNDGSTDRSAEILQKFADSDRRIAVITQENQGLSVARNVGISAATGEFIGFVDSDDWVDLNFFESLYRAAITHNAEIACGSIIRDYESGKKRNKVVFSKEELVVQPKEKYLITGVPRHCYVWNKIYNRKALQQSGVQFQRGIAFEDISFTTRALYFLKNLVTVPGVFYHYWVNRESITRQITDKARCDLLNSKEDFKNFSITHNIKLDDRYYTEKVTIYRLFGLPVMKVSEWKTMKKYYLFKSFLVFEKTDTVW